MALTVEIARICHRLSAHGWRELLAAHGLDIGAPQLERELSRPLDRIDRGIAGFEDFACEGMRGVEPGSPARSLLYHALASPRVLEGPGTPPISAYPTLRELAIVENYIFAAGRSTIASLRELAGGHDLAVVVFAYEYRPAAQTCHRRHADLVFSRTGVSRIGTAPPRYEARFRGFVPHVASDPHAFRVLPARYGAFVAARVHGSEESCCPMRYRSAHAADSGTCDADLDFWVPLHKLFDGGECLHDTSLNLQVRYASRHVNEKIRRVHIELAAPGRTGGAAFDTGWRAPDIHQPPFCFTSGIAELASDAAFPPGLLVPVPHERLVEPAIYLGRPLGFNVPEKNKPYASSLRLQAQLNERGEEVRPAPAYVHARTRMKGKRLEDLNRRPDVARVVGEGGYVARHYVDYTADGWVTVHCPALTGSTHGIGGPMPAYSLVAPPDFLFRADQREAMEWTDLEPGGGGRKIWPMLPTPLSDERLPANLQLPETPFSPADRTITALVSMFGPVSSQRTDSRRSTRWTHTHLPDDAAGVFAPGWDVARDWLTDRTQHLASYGLGSPFPEDIKLCAAISEFWPAVVPDASRTFASPAGHHYVTVCPLTDEEIGQQGDLPWDGVRGPTVVRRGNAEYARYTSFDNADYALNAIAGRMSLAITSHIDEKEFQRRIAAMAMAYRAVGGKRASWNVLSFRTVTPGDGELIRAQQQAACVLPGSAYRFELFRFSKPVVRANDPMHSEIPIRQRRTLFIDPRSPDAIVGQRGRWRGVRVKPA